MRINHEIQQPCPLLPPGVEAVTASASDGGVTAVVWRTDYGPGMQTIPVKGSLPACEEQLRDALRNIGFSERASSVAARLLIGAVRPDTLASLRRRTG